MFVPHQEPQALLENERICACKALKLITLKNQAQGECNTEDKKKKTATGAASHFSQDWEAPWAFALRRQVAFRRGPDSAHAWPAGRDRPRRAAYTWRRLPRRQTPPYAPAPASTRRVGGPTSPAAGTVTYGRHQAPRPFCLPTAVPGDLARQVPRSVSPHSPAGPGRGLAVSSPPRQ